MTRRWRAPTMVAVSIAATALLTLLLADRRHEFADAASSAAPWVLAVAVLGQVVALLARNEAWHLSITAAGGTVERRALYRASSVQVLGSLLSGQLGVAARIAALRRSSGTRCPRVATLIAAEFPILAVEATLAGLASFTLIGPLALPWWAPLVGLAAVTGACTGLRRLALIAVVTLGQLPVGPSLGAAAAVLILGRNGVAAAAAAGVLMTATGTVGGMFFAAWAGADRLLNAVRVALPIPAVARPEA